MTCFLKEGDCEPHLKCQNKLFVPVDHSDN